MLSLKNRLFPALALMLTLFNAAAFAQDAQKQDDTITEKGFRSKIFELKHRDPNTLLNLLHPLGSGFKGAVMTINRELKMMTVRDYPENLAVIEEAIKRLDTPEPARPDIEFRVHILIATNNPQRPTGSSEYPAELNEVIKQLQSTLSYKNYYMMTSQVLRTKEGPGGLGNKGVAELKLSPDTAARENPIFYDYRIERVSLEAASANNWKVQIGDFRFGMRIPLRVGPGEGALQYDNVGFNTPVGMREGEKVVVGTTSMQDKGIVIVIVADVIK